MKVPFRQQATEYDCVPTTFVNALTYLWDRENIPPIVLQRIYLHCLDLFDSHQRIGHGTSTHAVRLLGDWLDTYRHKTFGMHADYCREDEVHLGAGNRIAAFSMRAE